MPTILDIFNAAAFSTVSLTDAVNIVPNSYGRLNALGLFPDEPIPTTSVAIQLQNGVLNLLPTRPRGSASTLGTPEKRSLKSFAVPHIPHDDAVYTTDVQNMIAWAGGGLSGIALESVQGLVNRKLATMRRKHAITLENLRVGALKGVITDYDGSTLLNIFTEFGVTQQTFDFALGTAGTDVPSLIRSISGYMEDNLFGDTMTGIRALCSPSFMAKLLSHATVKNAYAFFMQTNPLRTDMRKEFTFQGITFEEYRGYALTLNEDKTTTKNYFIPDGDARFFPEGTTETFRTFWAPPDFMTEANQAPNMNAQVFVAPLEPMKFGKGMEVHTESNPLPICKRPQLLVRGFTSN